MTCPIPPVPVAASQSCQKPERQPPFVAELDGSIKEQQEAWLDEKNKNIARNMERARECAINHGVLVEYIANLPER